MTNLLSIEQNFLNLAEVKEALNLTAINKAKRNVANAQKRKFEHTMSMAALVKNAVAWYESQEGQDKLSEEGITWSKAEFGLKVFGWQKSFFYKVIKAANLDERIVVAFNTKCDEIGEDAQRSLAGLLKFAQGIDLDSLEHPEDATAEEIAEAEAEAIESAEVGGADRVETIYSFSFKNPDGKGVAVRIDANGVIKSANTTDEVAQAVSNFISLITNNL